MRNFGNCRDIGAEEYIHTLFQYCTLRPLTYRTRIDSTRLVKTDDEQDELPDPAYCWYWERPDDHAVISNAKQYEGKMGIHRKSFFRYEVYSSFDCLVPPFKHKPLTRSCAKITCNQDL